ncbi:MAG: class I tRNA ligase family protein, partial [Actinomycetota bacterium]|nr:class I tRNA ligase family protein [Actinomycetota bacterium]
ARLWPATIHFIGKDILWFHTVIWQAMLMALELPLPDTVFAHGFLQVGGEKMSKSKLTGISPHDLLETFGSDGVRYYLAREVSFGLDGEVSYEGMVSRYNADLANDLGNLLSRVIAMIGRYLDGQIPQAPSGDELTDAEEAFHGAQQRAFDEVDRAMDDIAPHEALKSAWTFVRKANAYVEETTPWALAKDDTRRRRLEVVLYELADALRLMALMLFPIIPRAAQEMWSRLGLEGTVEERKLPDEGRWGLLPAGSRVRGGEPLFPRVESDPARVDS